MGRLRGITLSETDKNGRRQREHNRARAAFSAVHYDLGHGAVPSKRHGTRRHTRRHIAELMVTRANAPSGRG